MNKWEILENKINIIDKENVILAYADIIPLKNSQFEEFVQGLIDTEINNIKVYDLEENSNMSDEDILEEFSDNFKPYFEFLSSLDTLDSMVFLDYIGNESDIKGLGKQIVDYLKENYDSILLFSIEDAIDYWESNGFDNVITDVYYFFKKEKVNFN